MKSKDPLSPTERSARMSKVRSREDRSTEVAAERALIGAGISGWVKHPSDVLGRPDFYFPEQRVALFIDGCFWHAYPSCKRRTPSNRPDFWAAKIEGNRLRDQRQRRRLRQDRIHVISVWEHEVQNGQWVVRLRRMLQRAAQSDAGWTRGRRRETPG